MTDGAEARAENLRAENDVRRAWRAFQAAVSAARARHFAIAAPAEIDGEVAITATARTLELETAAPEAATPDASASEPGAERRSPRMRR